MALLFRTRASLRVSSCPKLLSRTYHPVLLRVPARLILLSHTHLVEICVVRVSFLRARARLVTRERGSLLGVAEEEGNGTEEKREEDEECDETLYRDMTVDLVRGNRSLAVSLLFRKSSLA